MALDIEDCRDLALEYAEAGLHVYPVQPIAENGGCTCNRGPNCPDIGKHPFFDVKDCARGTRDKRKIKSIFRREANIGIDLQDAWVLDVEKESLEDFLRLAEEKGGLPIAPCAITGGGGRHWYFANDKRIKKGATKINGWAIDTPAKAVAPPSRHRSGSEYQWLKSPVGLKLASAPAWLVDWLTGKDQPTLFEVEDDRGIDDHPGESKGNRNETQCKLLGRFIKQNADSPSILIDAVEKAIAWGKRCDPPIPEAKSRKVATALVTRHIENSPQDSEDVAEDDFDLTVVPFSSIERKRVAWLWEGRFPLGKLTMLTGEGGVGKSMLTCYLAARVTNDEPLPDGSEVVAGDVLFIAGEDGAEDTIAPRLDASGADSDRVFLIKGPIPKGAKYATAINLQKHVLKIDSLLAKRPDVRMIVIDPVMDYLGDTNSYKDTEVRPLLSRLREVAEEHNVAVILINHLGKQSKGKNRSLGSVAFRDLCRVEMRVIESPDDEGLKLFGSVKNNLADPPTLAYRIEGHDNGAGFAVWEQGDFDFSILDVEDDNPQKQSARVEAEAWLLNRLSDGAAKSADLLKEANANQIAKRTLERAKKSLEVVAFKEADAWWTRLPEDGSDDAEIVIA